MPSKEERSEIGEPAATRRNPVKPGEAAEGASSGILSSSDQPIEEEAPPGMVAGSLDSRG